MSVAQYSFSEGLAELNAIAQQLGDVSDPDDVLRLEAEADAIADHCRALLRRPRPLRDRAASGSPSAGTDLPMVAADGGVIGGPAEPADDDETDGYPGAEQPTLDAATTDETAGSSDYFSASTRTLVLPSDPVRSRH